VSIQRTFSPGIYCINANIKSAVTDPAVYLRIFGPPESNFSVFRWADGEKSALTVMAPGGNNKPFAQAMPAPVMVAAGAPVPVVPRPPSGAGAATVHRDMAADDRAAQTAVRQQQYVEQLEGVVEDLQRQLAAAKSELVTKNAAIPSRAVSAARVATATPLSRLGMDRGGFRDVAKQVFDELGQGGKRIDKATAVNGLRLIVTLGAGMDEVFVQTFQETCGDTDVVTFADFCKIAEASIGRWAVLQP
jgi:hypothetical protein